MLMIHLLTFDKKIYLEQYMHFAIHFQVEKPQQSNIVCLNCEL